MKMFQRLRKFWVAILIVISATILCGFAKINGDAYISIVLAVMGMFGAHNVASKGK